MDDGFLVSLRPMECLATRFAPRDYVIACGGADPACLPDDIRYLADVMQRTTDAAPAVHVIPGAGHAVGPDDPDDLRSAYLDLVFGDS
jgi:hypothetical protein